MNLVLIRSGYRPVVIGPEHRLAYLNALQIRQLTENAEPYHAFMKQRLQETLTRYVEHIERIFKRGGDAEYARNNPG